MEQIPNTEKILSKAELDKQIEDLSKKQEDLGLKRSLLSEHIERLINSYDEGTEELGVFKTAKDLLENRIENPTLSDKLRERFEVIFGKKEIGTDPVESKKEFLDRRSWVGVSRKYKKAGGGLREKVEYIAEEKDVLRGLLGENLSFRGGKVEGEEKATREVSIQKIKDTIIGMDVQLKECADTLISKRDAALEAWKKENPEEWARLEEERIKKDEEDKKISLFEEFLKLHPTNAELMSVFDRACAGPEGEYFACVEREILKSQYLILALVKKIEESVEDVDIIKKVVKKYINMSNDPYFLRNIIRKLSPISSVPDLVKTAIDKFEKVADPIKDVEDRIRSEVRKQRSDEYSRYGWDPSEYSINCREIHLDEIDKRGEEELKREKFEIISSFWSDPVETQEALSRKYGVDHFPKVKIETMSDEEALEYYYYRLHSPYEKEIENAMKSRCGSVDVLISKIIIKKGVNCPEIVSKKNIIVEKFKNLSEEAFDIIADSKVSTLKDRLGKFDLRHTTPWEGYMEVIDRVILNECKENRVLAEKLKIKLESEIGKLREKYDVLVEKAEEIKKVIG